MSATTQRGLPRWVRSASDSVCVYVRSRRCVCMNICIHGCKGARLTLSGWPTHPPRDVSDLVSHLERSPNLLKTTATRLRGKRQRRSRAALSLLCALLVCVCGCYWDRPGIHDYPLICETEMVFRMTILCTLSNTPRTPLKIRLYRGAGESWGRVLVLAHLTNVHDRRSLSRRGAPLRFWSGRLSLLSTPASASQLSEPAFTVPANRVAQRSRKGLDFTVKWHE